MKLRLDPMNGLSEDHKASISRTLMGRKLPKSHVFNISKSMTGMKKSRSHVLSMSKSRLGKRHSEIHKDKISRAAARRIIEGRNHRKGRRSYYSPVKSDEKIHCMSSYELRAFQLLDSDPDVEGFIPQPFSIDICGGRRYVPDILVLRSSGQLVLVEVKPSSFLDDEGNLIKFQSAIEYCERNEMTFEVWDESILGI